MPALPPVFPPQHLTCPDPDRCPVDRGFPPPGERPEIPTARLEAGRALFRVYGPAWGYDEFNPGFGDARFSPFDDAAGHRVPALYLADSPAAALLETVFHDVAAGPGRVVYERMLVQKLLAHVLLPRAARVFDLRDPVLADLGIPRSAVASSPAEHYPCTRRLARDLLTAGAGPDNDMGPRSGTDPDTRPVGILWHSRQAELAGHTGAEVLVLFGDRYPTGRGEWGLAAPGARNLFEGPGRALVDMVAQSLDATVIPAG